MGLATSVRGRLLLEEPLPWAPKLSMRGTCLKRLSSVLLSIATDAVLIADGVAGAVEAARSTCSLL